MTHNPKVTGSSPVPATREPFRKLRGFFVPGRLSSLYQIKIHQEHYLWKGVDKLDIRVEQNRNAKS